MTLLRGWADDMPLHTWLNEHIWPFEAKMTDEDIYNGTRLACVEMIKSGTTFCADMYEGGAVVAKAISEMGMRGFVGNTFFDFFDPVKAEHMKKEVLLRIEKNVISGKNIEMMLAPHAIYTVSLDSLCWLAQVSKEFNLRVNIHISETQKEVDDCVAMYGVRPIELLNRAGLLNDKLLVAHAVHVNDEEIALLAERGVVVAHCPASNMKLASGGFRYNAMVKAGVKFAIATDGVCSDNNLDMMGEMKLAALRAKEMSGDVTVASAADVYERTTKLPAEFLGMNTGEVAVGKKADFILVNLDNILMVPNSNLISNIVYSANPSVIDYTVCDGNILMNDGVVNSEKEIVAAVRSAMERLK
ncbi:MAG: amidohydrolase [Bacteroidales bacterium]|jgi:5-methylthioadenosine/S-adenosylhomocysteine deaminase|nr:amidohydrolase [Bacteroidales bacterium]